MEKSLSEMKNRLTALEETLRHTDYCGLDGICPTGGCNCQYCYYYNPEVVTLECAIDSLRREIIAAETGTGNV